MIQTLSGTTALVAAGMLAGGAHAADPISIGVGGYFHAGVSIANQDLDKGRRDYGVDRESEIIFTGSTTLDNGLSVGVNVQLEGETSGDQIDESFMWIGGAFGQLRAGSFDGAMNVMGVYAPSAGSGMYGAAVFPNSTPVLGGGSNGEGAFGLGFDGDSAKIAWFSPTVGGVRVGVSFTPEGDGDDAANGSRSDAGTMDEASVVPNPDHDPDEDDNFNNNPVMVKAASVSAQQSEVFGIGANWTGDFSGASVSIGAGYTGASVEAGTEKEDDQEEWIIGLGATMDAISVGGNYSSDNNGKSGSYDRNTWVVGATYSMGPMTYGVTYANTSREQGVGNMDLDSDTVSFNATYVLGAGLSVTAGIQFWDIEDKTVGANEATVALIGTSVRF